MATKNQRGFLKSLALLELGIFEVIFVGIIIALILLVLNFFNIISLSTLYPDKFGFLPHRPTSETAKTGIELGCPVPSFLCNSAESVTYKGNPALGYKLPEYIPVMSVAPVIASDEFVEQPFNATNPKGLYQSYIDNGFCYVATYTLPFDAIIGKIDLLPLEKGTQIATTGASLNASAIDISGDKYSLVIQIQKRNLDTSKAYDFQQCPVKNLRSAEYGSYEVLDKNTFK